MATGLGACFAMGAAVLVRSVFALRFVVWVALRVLGTEVLVRFVFGLRGGLGSEEDKLSRRWRHQGLCEAAVSVDDLL